MFGLGIARDIINDKEEKEDKVGNGIAKVFGYIFCFAMICLGVRLSRMGGIFGLIGLVLLIFTVGMLFISHKE